MARIFISMSGEGRGHATRMRAVADELRARHEVTIFAPGDAFELLEPSYRGTEIGVEQIPGLRFVYTNSNRLDFLRTASNGISYMRQFPALRTRLENRIMDERPDLVITDFEPSLPRAARRSGVPFISINHQHFLIVNDLSELPCSLRMHALYMRAIVSSYYSGMARTIVSSFYFPPLKPRYRDKVVQVGAILRPSITKIKPGRGGYLLVYLRKFASPNVMDALRTSPIPVIVYGPKGFPDEENLIFREINELNFIHDLANCEALISTAGNQLVGEALFLGKPVLAMPEPANHEQYINAFYLAKEGTGEWVELEELNSKHLNGFLQRLDEYRARIVPEKYNGTPLAVQTVEHFL